jgi:hypothetical protein
VQRQAEFEREAESLELRFILFMRGNPGVRAGQGSADSSGCKPGADVVIARATTRPDKAAVFVGDAR